MYVNENYYKIIGNMASIGELPGKKIAEWHAKYGPIIRVRMGVQTWIMIGDPTLAHELFVSNGIESNGRLYTTYGSKYYSAGQRYLWDSKKQTMNIY
jgi:hypothetical protein